MPAKLRIAHTSQFLSGLFHVLFKNDILFFACFINGDKCFEQQCACKTRHNTGTAGAPF